MLIDKEAWQPLRYHPKQAILMHSPIRFILARAGRRSGKTECSRRKVVRALAQKKPWSDPNYFYALPTREQAKRVAWKALKRLVPKNWLAKEPSESGLTIETIFGSTLYVVGMDKPERLEGMALDGGVLDERADIKPGAWSRTILPALTDRSGWLIQTGVAKRFGVGAAEFNDLFARGLRGETPSGAGPNDRFISLTWPSADIMSDTQLAFAKSELSPLDYQEQFEAVELKPSGEVYYAFDYNANVDRSVVYNPDKPIFVGSDFNVSPMGWVLGQEYENVVGQKELHIFDEIFIYDTNTQQSLKELSRRYAHHKAGWSFYGDATGRARKSSAGSTATGAVASDYYHILSYPDFQKAEVDYPSSNPAVADRQSAVNAMLCNGKQERRLFISPECEFLIRDLQSQGYGKNAEDIGHIADGLGYLVWQRYPLRLQPTDELFTVGIFSG